MKIDLWKECLFCKNKCCNWDIAFPLFTTPEEEKKLIGINSHPACIFFNKNKLCDVHNIRPFDCRFFPFDIMKINGIFTWIIWKLNCPIVINKNKEEFEKYLQELEKTLLPKFKSHLENYSKFRIKGLMKKYKHEILRKIQI
ncbi:YkgJ family cysteine cluster protein [Candidatus Parcubacteria bacterium]|nr:YkgJ family cysteine cluster protein [Candidatus Parcubacteria bacterium]